MAVSRYLFLAACLVGGLTASGFADAQPTGSDADREMARARNELARGLAERTAEPSLLVPAPLAPVQVFIDPERTGAAASTETAAMAEPVIPLPPPVPEPTSTAGLSQPPAEADPPAAVAETEEPKRERVASARRKTASPRVAAARTQARSVRAASIDVDHVGSIQRRPPSRRKAASTRTITVRPSPALPASAGKALAAAGQGIGRAFGCLFGVRCSRQGQFVARTAAGATVGAVAAGGGGAVAGGLIGAVTTAPASFRASPRKRSRH